MNMFADSGTMQAGVVSVETTSNQAHPALQAQARAFKDQVEKVVEFYLKEAVKSDRTTVCNALNDAGHQELSELIRRL